MYIKNCEKYFSFVGAFEAPTMEEVINIVYGDRYPDYFYGVYEDAVEALYRKAKARPEGRVFLGENERGTITLEAFPVPGKPYAVVVNTCRGMWIEKGVVAWPLKFTGMYGDYGESQVRFSVGEINEEIYYKNMYEKRTP